MFEECPQLSNICGECQSQSAEVLALPYVRGYLEDSSNTPQPIHEHHVWFNSLTHKAYSSFTTLLVSSVKGSRLETCIYVVMGYILNGLDEPGPIAGLKPLLTDFGIHHLYWRLVCIVDKHTQEGRGDWVSKQGSMQEIWSLTWLIKKQTI